MDFKHILQQTIKDRAFLIVTIIMGVLVLLLVVTTSLRISPGELQVPIRYSSYGVTNFYRDKWYYLINFVVVGIVIFLLHVLIGMKLYAAKGRQFALPFMWLGVGIVLIASFMIFALFKVVLLT